MNSKDEERAQMETAYITAKLEVKELSDVGEISGYASIFDTTDQGGDRVVRGAFTDSLERHQRLGTMPKMLWQHDPGTPIGVWDEMSEDERGLRVKGRILKDVTKGREALSLLKAKAVDGLSIGYRTLDADFEDEGRTRLLKELDLWETSVVTFPMNRLATVNDIKRIDHASEVKDILRSAGVPKRFAELVARHGFDEAQRILRDGGAPAGKDDKPSVDVKALRNGIEQLKEALRA